MKNELTGISIVVTILWLILFSVTKIQHYMYIDNMQAFIDTYKGMLTQCIDEHK